MKKRASPTKSSTTLRPHSERNPTDQQSRASSTRRGDLSALLELFTDNQIRLLRVDVAAPNTEARTASSGTQHFNTKSPLCAIFTNSSPTHLRSKTATGTTPMLTKRKATISLFLFMLAASTFYLWSGHKQIRAEPKKRAAPPQEDTTQCPEGMILVDGDYCPKLSEHTCLKEGRSKPHHPPRCLRFSKEQPKCLSETRRQRFCIDKYEYPNKKGAHPPSLINAWDASELCREQGKRLCWESEWTMACEGPSHLPYPYGHTRDSARCNIDKPYLKPGQRTIQGPDRAKAHDELKRLDQSVPAGSMEGCFSPHGVYDMSGNLLK